MEGQGGGPLTPSDRQLVTIARSILGQPRSTLEHGRNEPKQCRVKQNERLCVRILVLDEATSSLDTGSEARVQGLVLSLLRQSTVLTVAHRLANILEYDR